MKKRAIIKKRTLFISLLLICCILSEIACTKLVKKPERPSELKVPIEDKILIAKILFKTSERLESFKDLKALAEISIQFPLKKIKRKNIILLRNDPVIRFEVLSISGRPLMYFTANSVNTSVYYPNTNTILKGTSSPENIARILGAGLELNKIITILSGNFSIPLQFRKIELNEDKDFYLIKFFFKNNKTEQIFVDKENFLPSKIEYYIDNGDLINIRYSNFKQIDNYFLPFMINIKYPGKNQQIFIKYKKVWLNQGISDSSFTLPINSGVKILPLENN